MLVYQHSLDRPRTPSAVAIGSFDGLHRGHQRLLEALAALAHEHHVPSVVYTFDQPTRVLLQGSKFLYSLAEKLKILEELGVDEVIAVPFTRAFSMRPPEAFLEDVRALQPVGIVVGDDFRFGHARAGGLEDLRAVTKNLIALPMFTLQISQTVLLEDPLCEPVKTSRIRVLLEQADVVSARTLLGRPYTAHGVVVHGDARGRTIGFPTANVATSDGKLLPPGVFAVRLLTPDGRFHDGMANVGKRPTIGGDLRESLEVNLFDFSGDLYGLEVRVDFLAHLRGEVKFAGLEALQAQLAQDRIAAIAMLKSETWGTN
jgi:riboflavin kinase / FMN adenylyltransferase